MLHEIVENIYLSDVETSKNLQLLQSNGITHVLAVLRDFNGPFPQELTYFIVPIDDVPTANLLRHFSATNGWISDVLEKNGKILVHCQAGVSRSPSIICSWLMKSRKWSRNKALDWIRQRKGSWIHPNEGFLDQLQWFEEMDYKFDPSKSKGYRTWMSQRRAAWEMIRGKNDLAHHFFPEFSDLVDGDEQSVEPGGKGSSEMETKKDSLPDTPLPTMPTQNTKVYKCRKCRKTLFEQDQVTSHERGHQGNCTVLFIEPLDWISGVDTGELEGKIECPKCHFKVGNWSWSGMPCSCGTWVSPGFGVSKAKVDESR